MSLPEVPATLLVGLVSGDQYRERSEKTKEILRRFLNLPCIVVVLGKEKDPAKKDPVVKAPDTAKKPEPAKAPDTAKKADTPKAAVQ